jgi:hypothetical protein
MCNTKEDMCEICMWQMMSMGMFTIYEDFSSQENIYDIEILDEMYNVFDDYLKKQKIDCAS